MKKMLSVAIVLMGLLTGLAAAAGSGGKYKFNLSFNSKIGDKELAAGAYVVSIVDASSVRLTEANSGKVIDLPAKVESGNEKFGSNAITTEKVGEAVVIREIRLGGSKTLLNFR